MSDYLSTKLALEELDKQEVLKKSILNSSTVRLNKNIDRHAGICLRAVQK